MLGSAVGRLRHIGRMVAVLLALGISAPGIAGQDPGRGNGYDPGRGNGYDPGRDKCTVSPSRHDNDCDVRQDLAELAADQVKLTVDLGQLAKDRVKLAVDQGKLSAEQHQLSADQSQFNQQCHHDPESSACRALTQRIQNDQHNVDNDRNNINNDNAAVASANDKVKDDEKNIQLVEADLRHDL